MRCLKGLAVLQFPHHPRPRKFYSNSHVRVPSPQELLWGVESRGPRHLSYLIVPIYKEFAQHVICRRTETDVISVSPDANT